LSPSLLMVGLQGLAIGLAVAAPVGPVGILCIRRTIERGPAIGLATGLGAAVADGIYGGIAAFGLGAAASALIAEAFWFRLVGGTFLILLAFRTMVSALRISDEDEPAVGAGRGRAAGIAFSSTILITLSNPATILTFAAIFAGTSIGALGAQSGAAIVLTAGVFVGSALWWFALVAFTTLVRHRLSLGVRRVIDILSGLAFLAFGVVVLWQAYA